MKRRDPEVFCTRCLGHGSIAYGSTATWRGGIGGAAITYDVCDHCWGSGDENEHWTDLRKLRNEEDQRVAERAADLLGNRCGVNLRSLLPALDELCSELDKFQKQRRTRPVGFNLVVGQLSKTLREMVSAKRVELKQEKIE